MKKKDVKQSQYSIPIKKLTYRIQSKLIGMIELIVLICFSASIANAHLPHDDVDLLAVSPNYHEDNMVMMAVRNNLLQSKDGGERWGRMINGLNYSSKLSSIAIPDDFKESRTIFVSTEKSGIFKSMDAGQTWTQIAKSPGNYTINQIFIPHYFELDQMLFLTSQEGGCFTMKGDGTEIKEVQNSKEIVVSSIVEGSAVPDKKLIIGDTKGNLYFYNGAQNMLTPIMQIPGIGAITTIAHIPEWQSEDAIIIGSEKGGLLKGRLGKSFEKISGIPSDKPIMTVAFSPDYRNDSKVFVSTWNEAVFISEDGGDHWKKNSKGLKTDVQADEGKLPHFRDIKFSSNFAIDKTLFMDAFCGIFRSVDGGSTWREMETFPAGTIVSLDVSPDYQNSQKVIFSTYAGGAFSLDSTYGNAWDILNYGIGFGAIRRTAIGFSPNYAKDNTLFATTNNKLLISRNSGKSWEDYNIRNIRWCPEIIEKWFKIGKFSKTEFGRPWVPISVTLSPDFASDQTIFLGLRKHGVIRSINGGKSFHVCWQNGKHEADSIVISPDFANDGTVFIGSPADSGVYRSTDRGKTWSESGSGLSFENNKVLLAISPNFKVDKTLFAGTTAGLFKSNDKGESWQHIKKSSDQDGYVEAIAVSPNYGRDQEMIISIRGRGLFKTIDGGKNFRQIGRRFLAENNAGTLFYGFPERSTPIKYSPSYAEDKTIYATSGVELFISTDGGENWSKILRPVRYEDIRDDVIIYDQDQDWHRRWSPEEFSNTNISATCITQAQKKGATATYPFYGTGVCWIGTQSQDQGIANIYIDGKLYSAIDQYCSIAKAGVRNFTIKNLPCGSHCIMIEVSGKKNKKSSGCRTVVDAFDVYP